MNSSLYFILLCCLFGLLSCNNSNTRNASFQESIWQFENQEFQFLVIHDSFIRAISIHNKKTKQSFPPIAIRTDLESYIDSSDLALHGTDSSDLFILQDVNFDGYDDIRVLNWIDHRFIDRTYLYWCYDRLTNSFVRDSLLDEIISPKFVDSLHQIHSVVRSGCCYNDTIIIAIKNKQLDTISHKGDHPNLEEMFGIKGDSKPQKDSMKSYYAITEVVLDSTYQDEIPLEAKLILKSLNSWDRQEIDAYEQPDKYPNYKVSGETNGYVSTKKQELKELGVLITWDTIRYRYGVK